MADHEIKGWGWDAVWVRRGGEKGKSHVRIQKWRMNKETWIKQGLFDCRETGQLDAIARMCMYGIVVFMWHRIALSLAFTNVRRKNKQVGGHMMGLRQLSL